MNIQESQQYQELTYLLQQYNNIYVVGSSGCGKTKAIHECLKEAKILFRRINLLQCQSKQSLLTSITKEISILWKINIASVHKFSDLIIALNEYIYQNPNQQNKGYIILDSPQTSQIEFAYLKKLFALTEIRSYNKQFNFVYICNQLPTIQELPLGIIYYFDHLDPKYITLIIYLHIIEYAKKLPEYQLFENDLKIQSEAFENAKDIFLTFSIFTMNLNVLITIGQGLFEKFVYRGIQLGQVAIQEKSNLKLEYKTAKNLLMDNPYQQIQTKEFNQLFEKTFLRERKQEKDQQKIQIEKRAAAQTLLESQIRLPKMASLILLSSFYASRNPERYDLILFKDMKKNKKPKKELQIRIKQKVTLFRLFAIAQSLMSLIEDSDFDQEKRNFNQSTEFYQQLQRLIDIGFIKVHQKKDDMLNKIKFECLITEKQGFELAESLKLKFDEFLYKLQILFEKFIEDLVADCVHGIKLPYLKEYPEINHYGLIIEAQQFIQTFSEYLLELNNQNKEDVQKTLDKLKNQMNETQHQIFTRIITENFKGMCKQALYSHIALSKYVLIDYNWNLNLTISSDKIIKSQIPTLLVEFYLQTMDTFANKKKIIFEMNNEELEQFIGKLQKVVTQLQK